MRWVLAILIVTGFLIWDSTKNQGRYMEPVYSAIKRAFR